MDNCKTDEKQIGYKLEWAGDEMIKECKEMLFEKNNKHIDYEAAKNLKVAVKEKKDFDKEVIDEIVKGKKATYETIKKEIRDRIISIPAMDVQYARFWLDAYSTCQNDILDLLERLESFDIERCKCIGNK